MLKANSLFTALWLVQPASLFLGIEYLAPRNIAFVLAIVILVRLSCYSKEVLTHLRFPHFLATAALLLLSGIVLLSDSEQLLKFYPALMNMGMLLVFASSLLRPPSFVEILARTTEPDFPQAAISYTRSVTIVWCILFAINGGVAFYTALYTSRHFWLLYNGFIAYVLMGILFAGEWLLRSRLIGKHTA